MFRTNLIGLLVIVAALGCGDAETNDGGGGGATGSTTDGVGGGKPGPQNQAPKAAFTATPPNGSAPLAVAFDASPSTDADGQIVGYHWAFEGGEADAAQVSRTFADPGCYPIELTVTDDDGATGTATQTVAVAMGEPELPPEVTVDVAPLASAVLPRDLTTNQGTAHFEGVVGSDGFTELRADVMDGDTQRGTLSIPLCGAAPVDFAIDVPIPAELTSFEVRLSVVGGARDPQQVFSIEDLVAGDIFVVQGQSNAVSAQQSGDADENQGPFVRSFGSNSEDGAGSAADLAWRMAEGNAGGGQAAIGQWPLRMGSLLSAAHKVPIGIINGARGGMPITYFQRNDQETTDPSTNYGRLLTRLRNAKLESSIRAFLWYQGESDGGNFQQHHDGFLALREDWAEDYAGVERTYVTQIRAGCGDDLIRTQEVQRKLADDFADITVMSTTGLDSHDGCHYAYENGYRELGNHYAALLGRDLYGETPALDVQPPNPMSAQLAGGGAKVVITMRNAASVLSFDDGAQANFRFEGSNATLSGGVANGATVTLDIDGDASGATGITYLGHQQAGPWILNENGVGLLEFFDLPVAPE